MNTWKIERRDYSSNPWRLVDGNGNEVQERVLLSHPDLGPSSVSMPVCGKTRQEVIDKVLIRLASVLEALALVKKPTKRPVEAAEQYMERVKDIDTLGW